MRTIWGAEVLILVVVEDVLVQLETALNKNSNIVLILVVVEDVLVLLVGATLDVKIDRS